MSKLFSIVRTPATVEATFSDGSEIPQSFIDAINSAHQRMTVEVELEAGDYLVLDNASVAQGRGAIGGGDNLFIALF